MKQYFFLFLAFTVLLGLSVYAYPAGCDGAGNCKNIQYAPSGTFRQLDLYLPSQATTNVVPVILFLHPGSWTGGDKSDCWDGSANQLIWPLSDLRNKGYAIACANYSYTNNGNTPFPTQVYESKAAVRWLRANAATYKLNPNKIGVWGWSAGGHMAAMLGATSDDGAYNGTLGSYTSTSSSVNAVAVLVGPTFFIPISAASDGSQSSAMYDYLGGDPAKNSTAAARGVAAAVSQYVKGGEPPMLLQYGQQDTLVPAAHGQVLDNALKAHNDDSTFKTYVGGHGNFNYYPDALAFFQRTLPLISCNNNNVCDADETPKSCPVDCHATITQNQVYCAKGDWVGKKDVAFLWLASTFVENPTQGWLCAANTTFYRCATSTNTDEVNYWNTFSTPVTNGQVIDGITCNLSLGKWQLVCTAQDYSCTAWSACTSTGQETRTCTKSNTNCTGGTVPAQTQSCTYTPPETSSTTTTPTTTTTPVTIITPTCEYSYGAWGDCNADGIQTRTEIKTPSECTGGGQEATTQNCTYRAPTCSDFTYSDWSDCNASGIVSRTIITAIPEGCQGGNQEALIKTCNFIPACTENNWVYRLGVCIGDHQLKTWIKAGTCIGGETRPSVEVVACTAQDNTQPSGTPTDTNTTNTVSSTARSKELTDANTQGEGIGINWNCNELDWKYTLDPTVCGENKKQIKYWEKTRACTGGVSHPDFEVIDCEPSNGPGIIDTIANFFQSIINIFSRHEQD